MVVRQTIVWTGGSVTGQKSVGRAGGDRVEDAEIFNRNDKDEQD